MSSSGRLLGPAVRALLATHKLSPSEIRPSGPHGIIIKGDVLKAAQDRPKTKSSKSSKAQPTTADFQPTFDRTISPHRLSLAQEYVLAKKELAHSYAGTETSLTTAQSLLNSLELQGEEANLSALLAKIVAGTVWKINTFATSEIPDSIAISVASHMGNGIAVVEGMREKDILIISKELKRAEKAALTGSLPPPSPAILTVRNEGSGGPEWLVPIILRGSLGAISLGGPSLKFGQNGRYESAKLSFSYDASRVSTEDAALFLAHVKDDLERCSGVSLGLLPNPVPV